MGVAPTFLGDLRRTVCTWGSCHWLVAVSRVKSPLLATYSDAGASRSTAVNLETCLRVWGDQPYQNMEHIIYVFMFLTYSRLHNQRVRVLTYSRTHNLCVRVLTYSRTHNLCVRVLTYSRTHNLCVRVLTHSVIFSPLLSEVCVDQNSSPFYLGFFG